MALTEPYVTVTASGNGAVWQADGPVIRVASFWVEDHTVTYFSPRPLSDCMDHMPLTLTLAVWGHYDEFAGREGVLTYLEREHGV